MEAQPAHPATGPASTPTSTRTNTPVATTPLTAWDTPGAAAATTATTLPHQQEPRAHPHQQPSQPQPGTRHEQPQQAQSGLLQQERQPRGSSPDRSAANRQPSRKSTKKKKKKRRTPSSSHELTWHLVKLILQCLSVVLCVVCLGLSIGLATSLFSGFAAVNIAIVCIVVLWNVADFVALYFRGSAKGGIHPTAQLGVHLLFWVAIPFSIYITTIATRNIQGAIDNCQWERQTHGRWRSSGDYEHTSCPEDMAHQLANPFFHIAPVTCIVMFCLLWCVAGRQLSYHFRVARLIANLVTGWSISCSSSQRVSIRGGGMQDAGATRCAKCRRTRLS